MQYMYGHINNSKWWKKNQANRVVRYDIHSLIDAIWHFEISMCACACVCVHAFVHLPGIFNANETHTLFCRWSLNSWTVICTCTHTHANALLVLSIEYHMSNKNIKIITQKKVDCKRIYIMNGTVNTASLRPHGIHGCNGNAMRY